MTADRFPQGTPTIVTLTPNPSIDRTVELTSTLERGAALRASLGVGDDSPLKPRTHVEYFENFDEYLVDWQRNSEHHRFFDSYTEPLDILAETAGGDRFRGYDAEHNAILFHDEPYHLGPISTAVDELAERAEREMQKPRFDLDPAETQPSQ